MSCNKKRETSEHSSPALMSDSSIKISEKDMRKDEILSESVLSVSAAGNAVSGTKHAIDQQLASEQSVYYPPTSFYDYYYPGYNGNIGQSDDKGYFNTPGGSYTGIQQDNSSLLYYLPGYGPYSTGFLGVDEKQAYPSSYGSEAFPCYTYDRIYAGNGLSSTAAKSGSVRSMVNPSGTGKSNGFTVAKSNNDLSSKTSVPPFNSKNQQTHPSGPIYQTQPLTPLNQFGYGFQPSGFMRGYHPTGNLASLTGANHCSFSQYGRVNHQSKWNNNFRSKSRENLGRIGEITAVTELTRGPRADNRNKTTKSQSQVKQLDFAVERDKYNLDDFQTVYNSAKFYVIKSYSEDDIHKCIKYDVWSSTPNGNKKLDVAFCEADAKTNETGIKCPVFLFFSVNGSGQFVGVAEMIGQVDFSKNMDFWQLDKWNGFFPMKWHIIKDVPNLLLRHIILENNENRAVTYSRDTQEIELKKGLEMLSIFKSYSAKTSILDDFNFYENREMALKARRNASQPNGFRKGDGEKHFETGGAAKSAQTDPSSLLSLTKNLSLGSQPLHSSI